MEIGICTSYLTVSTFRVLCAWWEAYQTIQQPWNIQEYHSLSRWSSQMAISAQKICQKKAAHGAAKS